MIDFNPDRLGHCCFLVSSTLPSCLTEFGAAQSEEQLEQVAQKNIPVEVCPTSNLAVCTSAYGAVSKLPHLRKLHELNHNFIICADDTSK